MAKSGGRMALYEVVNKARFKSAQQKALSAIQPSSVPADQSQAASEKPPVAAEKSAVPVWSIRPKAVRFYADRIELCFSWQVTALGLLALVTIFMVFFRFGQTYSLRKVAVIKASPQAVSVEKVMPPVSPVEVKPAPASSAAKPKMVEPMGDHVIVIASHELSSHLEPVKQYFAGFGIATDIIKRGARWLLVTQERFENPDKAGTDGFEMKKKIMSIGANYKPPSSSGFEPFGPKPFQDAYGLKINPP